mgnify:CR=1 FL=1
MLCSVLLFAFRFVVVWCVVGGVVCGVVCGVVVWCVVWCVVWWCGGVVCGVWCVVCGVWCVVCGVWCVWLLGCVVVWILNQPVCMFATLSFTAHTVRCCWFVRSFGSFDARRLFGDVSSSRWVTLLGGLVWFGLGWIWLDGRSVGRLIGRLIGRVVSCLVSVVMAVVTQETQAGSNTAAQQVRGCTE